MQEDDARPIPPLFARTWALSRRTFLALPLLIAWPFEGSRPFGFIRLVDLSPEQKTPKEHALTQKRPTHCSQHRRRDRHERCNLFFLTQPDGHVPLDENHGFGLYYHDCRYLNGSEVRLAGTLVPELAGSSTAGYLGKFELSNPDIKMVNGTAINKEEIDIRWDRLIHSQNLTLHDRLTFRHHGRRQRSPIAFTFQAEFEDIFAIMGVVLERLGTRHEPIWKNGMLSYLYMGHNKLYWSVSTSRQLCITRSVPEL